MGIASRPRAQRVGDHACPTCGGPGRFYRVGRHARLHTLCFGSPAHGTLVTVAPARPVASRAA